MSSYYQKINTLYKRDMTKPKKPIILGEYSEPEFEVLKDLKWEATEKIDGTNMSCCFHPGFRMIEIRGKTQAFPLTYISEWRNCFSLISYIKLSEYKQKQEKLFILKK